MSDKQVISNEDGKSELPKVGAEEARSSPHAADHGEIKSVKKGRAG